MSITKPKNKFILKVSEFEIVQELDQGGFATIYLVKSKASQELFAAKVNKMEGEMTEQRMQLIAREIGILARVQHPTIIKFHGFSLHDFEDKKNPTIIMDYMEKGSLLNLLLNEQKGLGPDNWDNTRRQIVLVGIARGMMILHSHHVIHRDLKPGNILLDENLHPHITDFGLSKFFDPQHSRSQSISGCGTLSYMAPEIFKGNHYNSKADVYAFGILMFEVLTSSTAYATIMKKKNFNQYVFGQKIVDGLRPEFKVPVSKAYKKLIERCWAENPKERPTFEEIFRILSLSPENDFFDETKSDLEIKEIIESNPEEDEEEEEEINEFGEFCLPDVDINELLDYVDEITHDDPTINPEYGRDMKELVLNLKEKQEILEVQHEHQIKEIQKKHEDEIKNLKRTMEKKMKESINAVQTKYLKEIEQQNNELHNGMNELYFSIMRDMIKNENVTHVSIPSNITAIISNAFEGCTSLTHVSIASTITMIGNDAFKGCKSITDLTIPESVKSLGHDCFSGCTSLVSIKILAPITMLADSLFFECSSLTIVNIPTTVKSLENDVFRNCTSLIQITIPESVETIGESAFRGCSTLTDVKLPSNLKYLKKDIFRGCSSLVQIELPMSLEIIGDGAFRECSSLSDIRIPSNVTDIKDGAFSGCTSLKDVSLPNSVKTIGDGAFFECKSISTIEIPHSIISIGHAAFGDCSALQSFEIPSSVTIIQNDTFNGCSQLANVTIPTSVIEIKSRAFSSCNLLKEISVPSSVEKIETDAFETGVKIIQ